MPAWQTLGVRHLVVAVNKMDECEWGKARAPPPSRTKWTRRVPHPVLIGHAASLTQVFSFRLSPRSHRCQKRANRAKRAKTVPLRGA